MVQDASQIKDRIVSVLRAKGPNLPVHISKDIGSSILFASAFLSELVSEKIVKVSYMRVGSSPVYFLSGQEQSLEKFSPYLKSREKEAFFLLKEKGFLNDKEQSPAVRVAIREIRDFAIPFKSGEDIVWRYFLVPESEFVAKKEIILPAETEISKIPEEKKVQEPEVKERARKTYKKGVKKAAKKDEGFFISVKEFIASKSMELLDIENFGAKEIILKVNDNGQEKLLVAYNKNKITEGDILKAAKKAAELKLGYMIIGKGGPLKRLENILSAVKNLSFIEKIK